MCLAIAGAAMLADAPGAQAYSGSEHIRFPDQAYQVMNVVRRGAFYADQAKRLNPAGTYAPLTARPPGVPASQDAAWQTFIAQVIAAPAKLDNVFIGLPNPPRASTDCGGVYANLPAGASFAQCRAGDLGFAPRRDWAKNDNECYLRQGYRFGGAGNDANKVTPFYQGLPTNYTGALLGMWATKPDDETNDTSVFIRPTNILFIGRLKELAEQGVELAVTAVVAPIFCFAEFLATGSPGACFDDAVSASHDFDPVARIDDSVLLPIEEWSGAVTGPAGEWLLAGKSNPASMWHFAVPSAAGNFNVIPGIQVANSRLNNETDSVDQGLTAYFDLTGLTMNPSDSTGPSRYGQFADGLLHRHDSDWASFSIAHVEFDPVDNLARYGWQQFLQTGTARGLGWVLHAIGDAFCPHHTIGSLGWGHQPWERFANVRWVDPQVFLEDDVSRHYPNMVTELTLAFQYWDKANQTPQTDWVGRMVEQLAVETFNSPFSTKGRAFQGSISVEWGVGLSDSDSDATDAYDGERAALKDLMMRAVGASIAFLAKASASAPAAGTSLCACTSPFARSAEDRNGALIPAPGGACLRCGTGVFAATPNFLDGRCVAACPPDKPTVQSGVCTAAQACPAATPFVKNGACVASCCPFDATCPANAPIRQNGSCVPLTRCSTPVVVNNRQCAVSCPSGQTRDPATFFCTTTRPPAQSCSGRQSDGNRVCCASRGSLCTAGADCCSGDCRSTDGICRGVKGDACVVGNDCVSQVCKGNVCTGTAGSTCQASSECQVACQGNKCCAGFSISDECTVDADCCPGASCQLGTCQAVVVVP